jgi:hypothetical protein
MEDKSTVSLALCRSDLCLSLFISIGDLWVGPSNIVLPGTFQQFQKWKACKKGGRYERGLLILVQYKLLLRLPWLTSTPLSHALASVTLPWETFPCRRALQVLSHSHP